MYYLYLFNFKLLYTIGLKKTSVRFARYMEKYCRHPLDNSKLYDAYWEFTFNVQSYQLCMGYDGCYFPILSDNDKFHTSCRDAQAAEEARYTAEEEAYWDSLDEVDDFDDDPLDADDLEDEENEGCPHCGSYSCDTWDCQQ